MRSSASSFVQDDEQWLDLSDYSDVAFWIDVSDLSVTSGTLWLYLETSPTLDEALFWPLAGALQLTSTPALYVTKSVRAASTAPLARYVRCRLALTGGSGAWSATFRIRAVGGQRFFAPTDVPGCLLWLRSDLGITSAFNSAVTSWGDQSGNARNAAQGTGVRQPSYLSAVINGFPAVSFDGSNDVLITPQVSIGTYTALMVATGQNATNGFFWCRTTGGSGHDTLYGSTNSTMYIDRGGTVSGWDLSASWGQYAGAKLLTVQFDGTHAGHTLRINGQTQTLSPTFSGNPGTGTVLEQICIGARDDAAAASATKVAEVLFYDSALSAAKLARVEDYLRRRYSLF